MSQHDFDIANQASAAARADINLALKALASQSSGSVAPTTTYANMLWYDTGNNILKMRAEADDAWINIAYLDQSADAFRLLDDTQVVNTSGAQTGLLGDQTTAAWEGGTSTTESLTSPAKVKAAIEALASSGGGVPNYQVFTSSGTYTPTVGAIGAEVIVTGAGGGSDTTGSACGGAGGTSIIIIDLTAAGVTSSTITVGAGGSGVGGTSGGSSTWNDNGSTPTITSTGGAGATSAIDTSGGVGSASADIAIDGSGGTDTDGGGGSYWGGSSNNSNNSQPYGAGGQPNKNGANGVVVVKEFY